MPASDRSYPSVWARPRRKERSTLTREQIVTEALRLLDTEGIEALSMRKLAAGLGAGATSLYWHVANRDELIELVIDEIYREVDVPDAAGADDWRPATRRFAHSTRATILRHPWLVSVLDHVVAAHLGPNLTRVTERLLALFETAGFPLREADRAASAVSSYVLGVSVSEAAWRNRLARRGQTAEDWIDEGMRVAEGAMEDNPRLREVVTSIESEDAQASLDEDFDYGLERMLDGLQARLDAP
jgi:AcrR family transcriptional regulator